MSDAKKDVEQKKLSKQLLRQQISVAQEIIDRNQKEIVRLAESSQQNFGIIGLSKHLLEQFDIPETNEEKKPELEVK